MFTLVKEPPPQKVTGGHLLVIQKIVPHLSAC